MMLPYGHYYHCGGVAVVLSLTVVVGLAAALGRQHISEDYFVAGRSLPWYVVACSVAGLSLRMDMWLGLLGLTYVAGVAAGGLAWGSFIGLTVFAGVFLPYFVRKKISSPAEFLQRRYSPATRGLFAVLSILFLVVGVLVPALYVGGWVLAEAVLGVPLTTANGIPWVFLACVAGVALISSPAGVIGGSMAGAWGGAVQMLLAPSAGPCSPSWRPKTRADWPPWEANSRPNLVAFASHHSVLPWVGMFAFPFTIGLWNTAVSPLAVQRCLGAQRMGRPVARSWRPAPVGPAGVFVLPGLAAAVKLGPLGNGLATEAAGCG